MIPMDNFTEHYARMTANDGDDLEEEYSVGREGGREGQE